MTAITAFRALDAFSYKQPSAPLHRAQHFQRHFRIQVIEHWIELKPGIKSGAIICLEYAIATVPQVPDEVSCKQCVLDQYKIFGLHDELIL